MDAQDLKFPFFLSINLRNVNMQKPDLYKDGRKFC